MSQKKAVSKVPEGQVDMLVDRHQLVAYLAYAIDEVAVFSETSASLLRMAIADLAESPPDLQPYEPMHKLS
jgi:hypothetical protein